MASTANASFSDAQRTYWGSVDEVHFHWQTDGGYVASTEAALLSSVALLPGERLLEIGCGEGGNLHHLSGRGAALFGVDFIADKVRFARHATGAATARADAARLPFADGTFDVVLVRDLLHHVPDRLAVLREAHRVLVPHGRLTVIEPNGRNPLVLLQAATVVAERGVLRSTGKRLEAELGAAGFQAIRLAPAQPLPISRVLFHPSMGMPALERLSIVPSVLGRVERALERLPHALWAYLVAQGEKQ